MNPRPTQDHQQPIYQYQVPQPYIDDEYEISLKELLLILIKGKKTIALITAVVLVFTTLGSLFVENVTIGSKGEVQTAVKLYFNGIQQGKTPEGLPYDINELKSAEILQNAMSKISLSHEPTVSDLQSNISFEAVLPDEVAKTLSNLEQLKDEELKLQTLENINYFPDTYIVKLNVANDLGISAEEGRELLDQVILEYKNWLVEKYADYAVLPDIFADGFSLDDYDYIQAADLLNGQLSSMQAYVEARLRNREFNSSLTGMSPMDLSSALDAIRTVELEQLYTLISTYYVTKNAGKSIAIYEQMAEKKEREAAKKLEEAQSLKAILTSFQANDQTIVIGDGTGIPINIKTQNQQYDAFVTRFVDAGTKVYYFSADAAYYKGEAERFRQAASAGTAFSGPETTAAQNTNQLIKVLQNKMVYWTTIINETTREYYSVMTYQKYIEQLIPTQDYDLGNEVNLPRNMGIGLVAGLMLGVMAVFFRSFLKEDEDQTNKESVEVTAGEA